MGRAAPVSAHRATTGREETVHAGGFSEHSAREHVAAGKGVGSAFGAGAAIPGGRWRCGRSDHKMGRSPLAGISCGIALCGMASGIDEQVLHAFFLRCGYLRCAEATQQRCSVDGRTGKPTETLVWTERRTT